MDFVRYMDDNGNTAMFLMGGNDYVAKNLSDVEEYKRSIEEEFKPSK